jgi:hypothetical protein
MVTENEVEPFGDNDRRLIFKRSVVGRDKFFVRDDPIPDHDTLTKRHAVARCSDDPFDQGQIRVVRVQQHDNVPNLWIVNVIRELVDYQAVLVMQRWLHASSLDASDLEAERHDQGGVDGSGSKRAGPEHEFGANLSKSGRVRQSCRGLAGRICSAMRRFLYSLSH